MRFSTLPTATQFGAALLGAALLTSGGVRPGWAQTNPNAEQLIKALTPSNLGGGTRGVRMATPAAAPVAVAPTPAQALPSASLSVLFASGSADLTPSAIKTLDTLAKALTDARLAGGKFRIEGHTDTVGTADTNKALSEQRAQAVVGYLTATHHVDPGKLEPVGMGEEGLLIPTRGQTPEPRNRRVVIVNLGG